MKVKFIESGDWGDPVIPNAPILNVKAGKTYTVSDDLGHVAILQGKAVEVKEEKAAPKVDKARAEENPAKKDKRRATKR